MISCEVSVLILMSMSMERFVAIVYPFSTKHLNNKRCMFLLSSIWLLSFVIAGIPVIVYRRGEFYGSTGVCFPLHIQYPYSTGWHYSAAVFIGLNSVAMITVVSCYVVMFVSLSKPNEHLSSSIVKDTGVAKRMFALVATDAACWIPVILVKILALSGIIVSPTAYGWISIFVLPVNSVLNPFLYSITTPSIWSKIKSGVRCEVCQDNNINAPD
jgi:hypothetical protein